ncbi:MAG: cytochrome c biogenesis heme-transporting ATPase CcmA [Cellvibrionaceae bacterium]|nr:cytochrome c biogenesis heme-transporting ATPase CcmA [Cellvibrionaceae bacterium]
MTPALLELHELACERDGRQLFAGLNWQFEAGQVVQIVGPNGAGKTTLLRALVSLSSQYQGQIHFAGKPLADNLYGFRQQLLYLGHLPGIKAALTPAENLRWYAGLRGEAQELELKLQQALQAVGLYGYEDQPSYSLSAGQQRRVGLARLYLSQAKIWVLDEPLTAIDKAGVARLESLFKNHTEAGGLVIITTHQDLQLDNLRQLDLCDFPPGEELDYA